MMNKSFFYLMLFCLSASFSAYGHYLKGEGGKQKTASPKGVAAGCTNPIGSSFLEINNVRALIHTGGDMFWDLKDKARYEVPKNSNLHSMFVSNLWLGGTDKNDQLRIAASRYRSAGVDYWTGPLNTTTAEIDPATCAAWDKHFRITKAEVVKFIAWKADASQFPGYTIPKSIIDWPAHGDLSKGQAYNLAPFCDMDNNSFYDPEKGDFPRYEIKGTPCEDLICNRSRDRKPKLFGDETIWWVFNDKGNIHRETGSEGIGMEIQAQEFAFATSDEINNMTFSNYIIINRSTFTLCNTYFGTNFDPDIGCSSDDFVGCDVKRGLGYAYNGDAADGSPCPLGSDPPYYSGNPPAIGIDFFEGPYMDNDNPPRDNPKFSNVGDAGYFGYNDTTGLNKNDAFSGGSYLGSIDDTFYVTIFDTIYLPNPPDSTIDLIIWNRLGTAPSSPMRITPGIPIMLDSTLGVTITFRDSILHDSGDVWKIAVSKNKVLKCDPSINGLNFGDGILDNERWGMRRFIYYSNCNGNCCDPNTGLGYYRLLRGFWTGGQRMIFGGDGGCGGGSVAPYSGRPADFMFPGDPKTGQTTDPCGWGTSENVNLNTCTKTYDFGTNNPSYQTGKNWTEIDAGNTPGDRRFVHSAGPFTLEPGATNDITTGAIWAKAENTTDAFASVELVRIADDKAQALFDNCFKTLDGPDAPALTIQECDKELIIYLSNPKTSNNYLEKYAEKDPTIVDPKYDSLGLNFYSFQGYQLYQLKDVTISVADIEDPSKAQLIGQCDIKDTVVKLINYTHDDNLNADVPKLMVDGKNLGIVHSFYINQDKFASGDKNLVNHKKYYFLAVAYGYNEFKKYTQDIANPQLDGQKKPYLRGRKNGVGGSISAVVGLPHICKAENDGTQLNSIYGDSPEITRYEGKGNGGLVVDLAQETIDEIMSGAPWRAKKLKYVKGKAPLDVKVVDPLNVRGGNFAIYFNGIDTSSYWMLVDEKNTLTQNIRWKADVGGMLACDSSNSETFKDITRYLPRYISTCNGGPNGWKKDYIYQWNKGLNRWDTIVPIYKDAVWEYLVSGVTGSHTRLLVYDGTAWQQATDVVHSDQTIRVRNEQIVADWGIAITAEQVVDVRGRLVYPGFVIPKPQYNINLKDTLEYENNPFPDNGFLEASMTFSDPLKPWLRGVQESDAPDATNWVRSGTNEGTVGSLPYNDFGDELGLDSAQVYEKVLGGIFAPYRLCSRDSFGPALDYSFYHQNNINNISSVDLYITSDQSKWTRSVVLDVTELTTTSEGNALKGEIRKHPSVANRKHASVAKDGKTYASDTITIPSDNPQDAHYISPTGMGWFPGYAIDVETGQRLNIIFAENSGNIDGPNGRDMLWNPTSGISSTLGDQAISGGFGAPGVCTQSQFGEICIPFWGGGKHWVYIMGHNGDDSLETIVGSIPSFKYLKANVPVYDGGAYIRKHLDGTPDDTAKWRVFKDAIWAGELLLQNGYKLDNPANGIPSDVKIRLRVRRPYERYAVGDTLRNTDRLMKGEHYIVATGPILHNGVRYKKGDMFEAVNDSFSIAPKCDSVFFVINSYGFACGNGYYLTDGTIGVSVYKTTNAGNPLFRFSMSEFETKRGVLSIADSMLDQIKVVPNPYYGFSAYETTQLDNKVLITNLPKKCTITIYTVNGTLVRRFERDDATIAYVEWDLKNHKSVPVGSGLYIIHINAPGIGEKILKWFGVLRPVDLDSF